ncbi:Gfo/Idh/MocA family protein [Mumia sp. Pv 4-285]|uniref:Gfo/Idh/MocA family protein n=1 Tax=Mumia qirimensis TaxID=3234852 RepID=UPI00351D3D72
MTGDLGVGVVGLGWMGEAHTRAYARLLHHYPAAPLRPRLVAVADPADDDRIARGATAYGFAHTYTDWHDLLDRDDVDVVSVTGPNYVHAEIGVAVAEAGKHLWIEKPVGRSAAETRAVAAAVQAAGVQSAVGFNYRNAPAVERARELVGSGRLGTVTHVDVRFCSDYAAHPQGALSWRFQNAYAGSGVLGDLVSHAADLARYVVGEIAELVADDARFVAQRPPAVGAASHFSRGGEGPLLDVENEDYVGALLRFAGGARGTLVSSRASVGEQCTYGIEVHGTSGALAWDFRRMGELRVCLDQDYQDASYATWFSTPRDGELGAFQPGTGIAMGYDDLKVIEAERLVRSIADGKPYGATLHDAVVAAETVEALGTSVAERRWVSL